MRDGAGDGEERGYSGKSTGDQRRGGLHKSKDLYGVGARTQAAGWDDVRVLGGHRVAGSIDAGRGGRVGWLDRERTAPRERTPMTIDLKPEQQRVIDLAVRSGAYRNPGEVLDQAFEIIRGQLDLEDWMFEQREAIAAHVEKGFAQAERGESIDGDAAVEMLRQRRAERLKLQG